MVHSAPFQPSAHLLHTYIIRTFAMSCCWHSNGIIYWSWRDVANAIFILSLEAPLVGNALMHPWLMLCCTPSHLQITVLPNKCKLLICELLSLSLQGLLMAPINFETINAQCYEFGSYLRYLLACMDQNKTNKLSGQLQPLMPQLCTCIVFDVVHVYLQST